MSCADVRDLLPAFGLDALADEERKAVETHLAHCAGCAAEAEAYLETAAVLALSLPPHEPSPALKRRLLAAASSPAPAPARGRRWAWAGLHARPATLAAGFALALALGTTVWAGSLQRQLDEQRAVTTTLQERAARYDRVVAVLQSPELQVRPMVGGEIAPNAVGQLYVDPRSGSGMLMVRSMPRLPEGRAYQIWWVKADGTRDDGGLLTWTDPQGSAYTLLQCPAPCQSYQRVGLTEEPAGGSLAPTGQRVIGGTL